MKDDSKIKNEFRKFNELLKDIISISNKELKIREAKHKTKRTRKKRVIS